MEGSLRQYGRDPFSIGYHACSERCTGNGSREKDLAEAAGILNYKNINFYKFSGKDKQEEKCVVQYPGNHLNRQGSGGMHNQLTENDIKRMKEEIEHRKLVVRKEALEAVKEARAQGDLSENFEYYAAKREKNRNESRIWFLERMIKTAEIIPEDSKEDEVGVNNTVELLFEEDQTVEKIKIVTTMRGNSLEGLVSTESPIGKALLGHKTGDRVYVEVNGSYGYYVVIRSIEKTVDDGSDKIRSF